MHTRPSKSGGREGLGAQHTYTHTWSTTYIYMLCSQPIASLSLYIYVYIGTQDSLDDPQDAAPHSKVRPLERCELGRVRHRLALANDELVHREGVHQVLVRSALTTGQPRSHAATAAIGYTNGTEAILRLRVHPSRTRPSQARAKRDTAPRCA